MVNYRGVKLNERNTLITAEIMQTYDLLKFALARSNGSSFLLITQYEMPFINKSEKKRSERSEKKGRKTEKYTANVQMARTVGVVFGLSFLFTSVLLKALNIIFADGFAVIFSVLVLSVFYE